MMKVAGLFLAAVAAHSAWAAPDTFTLKNGDSVVFYGDSITDLRDYTTIIETFVATRYPHLDASFVNSGWGGDTVNGGGGGPIDTRIKRDIFPYRPNIVTIMLGMNDGGYKAETESNDQKYFSGYKHIVSSIHQELPQARIFAIEPSPYDDVTRPPAFPISGDIQYNEVMRSFGKWIAANASELNVEPIDGNTNFVKALKKANELDPQTAKQILSDHIHPSFGGSLILAESILKAWQARPVVSEVVLEASKDKAKLKSSQFATVSNLSSGTGLSWTQLDESLPLPFQQWIDMWGGGASVSLAIKSSDVTTALNQQILKVHGMPGGTYSLRIDGTSVGAFNNDQLAEGINLAVLKTPATEQAMKVFQLAKSHEEIHNDRWRHIDVPLADYNFAQAAPASTALDQLDDAIAKKMREVAAPAPHKFELLPITDTQPSPAPGK
ncbi:SGNH/GDSL hydrolase family protein [Silvibacterium acidisoli]|uniref:SGNH/GDSL hydrolase family protein n=1 Tax=Acidobacteriaceae bacterium ZG23-2 TaxID=2883246 RepID=UPI00406D4073